MKELTLTLNLKKRRSGDTFVTAAGSFHFNAKTPVVAIFGASGAGKSTLLRWLAGFDKSDGGSLNVEVDGVTEVWEAPSFSFTPQQRRIGYVAQGYALFPHLNVRENIAYSLRRVPSQERDERVQQLIELFELKPQAPELPATLSGGQKQRVAFARALAARPRLLLLDEPFSALDYPTRERLIPQVKSWLSKFETPTILVTHDPREADALGAPMLSFVGNHLRFMSAP